MVTKINGIIRINGRSIRDKFDFEKLDSLEKEEIIEYRAKTLGLGFTKPKKKEKYE